MFRLIPAHEPGGPQSVGGLFESQNEYDQVRECVRELDNFRAWSGLGHVHDHR